MIATESRYDIRFEFGKACWKIVKDGKILDEEYISCNDAIDEIERYEPKTAELLWKQYFSKEV